MRDYSIKWGKGKEARMDPIKTIGQMLSKDEDRRDAIHIAIMPVTVEEDCGPGQHVGFVYGSKTVVKRKPAEESIGVIDPYIKKYVKKGSKVWLFMHPGTVTGMRHQWSHPGVDEPHVTMSESEEWLRRFADRWNFDYGHMIAEAQEDEGTGIVVAGGVDLHGASELDPGDEDQFWHHIEVLTGKKFGGEHRSNFTWSCSC